MSLRYIGPGIPAAAPAIDYDRLARALAAELQRAPAAVQGPITVEVPLSVNGREFARATARDISPRAAHPSAGAVVSCGRPRLGDVAGTADDPPSDAEFAAYFEPSGPAAAARNWLRLVLEDADIEAAWPLTDPNLRLCLVQNLIWANHDIPGQAEQWFMEQLAYALAEAEPAHPAWPAMQRALVRIFQEKWKGSPPLEHLSSVRPRMIDPLHELVFLVDGTERTVIAPGESVLALALLMANRDGRWLVAGFGEEPPIPGWPPVFPHEDRHELS